MEDNSIQCCVTSPPYFNLRDYGVVGQIGIESSPEAYLGNLCSIFKEVFRVLKKDGTLWLNIGDSYAANRTYQVNSTKGGKKHSTSQGNNGRGSKVPDGMKKKDMIGIPWSLAFKLRDMGFYLRQDIIWEAPNTMPESVKDRLVSSYEHIFLLSKSEKYYFDFEAIMEDSHRGKRRKRDVWRINTANSKSIHTAVFPEELVENCLLAGTKEGDKVLDPFVGSGTTLRVAKKLGRNGIGIELNPAYADLIKDL